jgi:hypothetical protein
VGAVTPISWHYRMIGQEFYYGVFVFRRGLPQVAIKLKTKPAASKERSIDVKRMLGEIGKNGTALNTTRMEQGKLKPVFKDFNPEKSARQRSIKGVSNCIPRALSIISSLT